MGLQVVSELAPYEEYEQALLAASKAFLIEGFLSELMKPSTKSANLAAWLAAPRQRVQVQAGAIKHVSDDPICLRACQVCS